MAPLTNIISTGAYSPQVEQVVVAIGTNDCTGNMPRDIAAHRQKLLTAIKAYTYLQLMLQQRQSLPRLTGDVTTR